MPESRPPGAVDGHAGDFIGHFEGFEGNQAVGWAFNHRQPSAPVAVEVRVDGRPVALGWASLFRRDVPSIGPEGGVCGFRLSLPESAMGEQSAEGKWSGTAVVAVANTGVILAGSPQPFAVTAAAPASGVRGDVNRIRHLTIQGWATDARTPGRRLTLDVLHEGQVVASAVADRFRYDLLQAGVGDGAHSFEATVPLRFADGRAHRFVLVVRETGDVLGQDGVIILAEPFRLSQRLRHVGEGESGSVLNALADYFAWVGRDLPTHAAFGDYAAWAALFPPPRPAAAEHWPACTALILSGGDPAAEAVTLTSLEAQTHPPAGVVILRPDGQISDERAMPIVKSALTGVPGVLRDLSSGSGPFQAVIPLLAGETLHADGLAVLAAALADGAAVAYADGEVISGGERFPLFAPDWNHTFLLHKHYIGPACLIRAEVLRGVEDGDRVEDLLFRAVEAVGDGLIRHVPRIAASRPADAVWPEEGAAVQRHLKRLGLAARVSADPARPAVRDIAWALPSDPPGVSLIIPTRDAVVLLEACIGSLLRHTLYPAAEIIIIDNGSEEAATHEFFRRVTRQDRIRVLPCPGPFNYAAINNAAVRAARGELVAFVNNDIEIPPRAGNGWLSRLVSHFSRPDVGAVGPKLLYENGMVQHGGVILGVNGVADHAFRHAGAEESGYDDRLRVPHELSAVTAALMVTRRDLFLAIGGFDQVRFPIAFNDVDYCLRLRGLGRKIVFDPTVALLHRESATRGSDTRRHREGQAWRETATMKERWKAVIAHDPAYNPNLNLNDFPFTGLAVPPRR